MAQNTMKVTEIRTNCTEYDITDYIVYAYINGRPIATHYNPKKLELFKEFCSIDGTTYYVDEVYYVVKECETFNRIHLFMTKKEGYRQENV